MDINISFNVRKETFEDSKSKLKHFKIQPFDYSQLFSKSKSSAV